MFLKKNYLSHLSDGFLLEGCHAVMSNTVLVAMHNPFVLFVLSVLSLGNDDS
jgi:hypothetical protein